jgi:hypothetical protein
VISWIGAWKQDSGTLKRGPKIAHQLLFNNVKRAFYTLQTSPNDLHILFKEEYHGAYIPTIHCSCKLVNLYSIIF